jgi:ribosomal protein S18 acetylase RimI-like enzyme
MLEQKPAKSEQFEEFLQMFRENAEPYIDEVLDLMDMDWEQFVEVFRTVGRIESIYDDDECAGFYWTEKRDRILHLHALILKEEFQRKGIGSRVLNRLLEENAEEIDSVELGVHHSNRKAKDLYEKFGFRTIKTLDDLDFSIMQKDIRGRTSD